MKIKICSLPELNELTEKYDYSISLLDVGYIDTPQLSKNHLILHFDDNENIKEKNSPRYHHIKTILRFTESIKDTDNVLVHCHAGVSRSAAVAIGILVQHGYTEQEAIDYCYLNRRIIYPNLLIAKILDNILNSKIERAVLKFRNKIDNYYWGLYND